MFRHSIFHQLLMIPFLNQYHLDEPKQSLLESNRNRTHPRRQATIQFVNTEIAGFHHPNIVKSWTVLRGPQKS